LGLVGKGCDRKSSPRESDHLLFDDLAGKSPGVIADLVGWVGFIKPNLSFVHTTSAIAKRCCSGDERNIKGAIIIKPQRDEKFQFQHIETQKIVAEPEIRNYKMTYVFEL
jgi:hypothetical protein